MNQSGRFVNWSQFATSSQRHREMSRAAIPAEHFERSILVLRRHKVLLDADEQEALRSQSVISNTSGRGGRRYAPYAFADQELQGQRTLKQTTKLTVKEQYPEIVLFF